MKEGEIWRRWRWRRGESCSRLGEMEEIWKKEEVWEKEVVGEMK